MSNKDEKEHDSVKVVDRRRLDDLGEERDESVPTPEPTPPKEPDTPPPPPSGGSDEADPQALHIDFATFIQSLAQQALMHMGVMPHPETGESQREMGLARQTIDILQILHTKTVGNLTEDEQRLFDAILHDLRLAFVQLSAPKA